jgi:hypothetical protein
MIQLRQQLASQIFQCSGALHLGALGRLCLSRLGEALAGVVERLQLPFTLGCQSLTLGDR